MFARVTRTVTRAAVAIAVVLTAGVLGATPSAAVAGGTLAAPGQYVFAARLTMPTSRGRTAPSPTAPAPPR